MSMFRIGTWPVWTDRSSHATSLIHCSRQALAPKLTEVVHSQDCPREDVLMDDREQQRKIRHRLSVLRHAEELSGNVAATCR